MTSAEREAALRAVPWMHGPDCNQVGREMREACECLAEPDYPAIAALVETWLREVEAVTALDGNRRARALMRSVDLNVFQSTVGIWAQSTFKGACVESILAHLIDEVIELARDKNAEEAADVLLLLLHFAHTAGFSLLGSAISKFELNKQRSWGQPDERGVVKHIPETRADPIKAHEPTVAPAEGSGRSEPPPQRREGIEPFCGSPWDRIAELEADLRAVVAHLRHHDSCPSAMGDPCHCHLAKVLARPGVRRALDRG